MFSCGSDTGVISESSQIFFLRPDFGCGKVALLEFLEFRQPLLRNILFAPQPELPRSDQGAIILIGQLSRLSLTNIIKRLVHVLGDVETIVDHRWSGFRK